MSANISRRSAMGLLGAGGIAGALATDGSGEAASPVATAPESALHPGARFGRWTIHAVHPVEHGALRIEVREDSGNVFPLDIIARDGGASRPPAEVGALAILVCNGGDGWSPTVEEHGLAAMTLARLLEKHGETGPIEGLLTHAERVAAHRGALLG